MNRRGRLGAAFVTCMLLVSCTAIQEPDDCCCVRTDGTLWSNGRAGMWISTNDCDKDLNAACKEFDPDHQCSQSSAGGVNRSQIALTSEQQYVDSSSCMAKCRADDPYCLAVRSLPHERAQQILRFRQQLLSQGDLALPESELRSLFNVPPNSGAKRGPIEVRGTAISNLGVPASLEMSLSGFSIRIDVPDRVVYHLNRTPGLLDLTKEGPKAPVLLVSDKELDAIYGGTITRAEISRTAIYLTTRACIEVSVEGGQAATKGRRPRGSNW